MFLNHKICLYFVNCSDSRVNLLSIMAKESVNFLLYDQAHLFY